MVLTDIKGMKRIHTETGLPGAHNLEALKIVVSIFNLCIITKIFFNSCKFSFTIPCSFHVIDGDERMNVEEETKKETTRMHIAQYIMCGQKNCLKCVRVCIIKNFQ